MSGPAFPNTSGGKLAQQLLRWQKSTQSNARIRYATVTGVSGETVTLTFAGSSNPIPGVPILSSYSPRTNDVVVVSQVMSDLLVLGTIGNDVPVGALVSHAYGPASTINFSSLAVAAGASTTVIAGHTYKLDGRALGTQQTTTAIVVCELTTNDSVAISQRFISTNVGAGVEMAGGGATLWTPTVAGTYTAAVSVFTSAGAFQLGANAAEIIVTRVA